MKRHLVVYVKTNDLQEFIEKLDSKGWTVIDAEPKAKVNYVAPCVGIVSIIFIILAFLKVIAHEYIPYIASILSVIMIGSLGFTFTYSYTLICEYTGNDELIDLTPLDDTDDNFAVNDEYDA